MPTAQTSGYDLVLQVSKDDIDKGLARFSGAFPQQPIKKTVNLPLKDPVSGIQFANPSYEVTLVLSLPTIVSFQPPANVAGAQVVLRSSFVAGSSLALKPIGTIGGYALDPGVKLELAGSVEMRCDVGTAQVGPPKAPATGKSVVARLDTANITLSVNGTLTVGHTAAGRPIEVDKNTLLAALGPLGPALGQAIKGAGVLPLTWPIPIPGPGVNSATKAKDFDFSAFQGSPEGLAVGVLSQCGGTGNAMGLRNNPGNLPLARLVCSNAWLVCFVCRALEGALGLSPGFSVNMNTATGTWGGAVTLSAPGGGTGFTLTNLTVSVPAGASGITISGNGTAGGFCWEARPSFSATVGFTCTTNAAGERVVTPVSTPVSLQSNVSTPWYCILAAIVLALIVGAIFGVVSGIIAVVIEAIVLSGLTAINPVSVATGALNSVLGMPMPVPVASLGIPCGLIVFDDLEVRGSPEYRDFVPKRSSGQLVLGAGQSFDLDAGVVASGAARDLAWTGSQLQAGGGAELVLLSGGFGDVTYRQLQQLSYATTAVAASAFPAAPAAPLVFGARTSEGLYARGAARRSATGGLELSWATYDRPSVSLSLAVECEELQHQEVEQGSDSCGTTHIEPTPPIKLIMNSFPFSGESGPPDPHPWAPYAGATRAPGLVEPGDDPGVGGGFGGQPTVHDLAERRGTSWGVVIWHEAESVGWVIYERAERITLTAQPELLTYPVKFRWTVGGGQVPAGSGQTVISGLTVVYDEDSSRLVIETQMGVGFSGQVCCSVTDADGRQVSACVSLSRPGRVKSGGCRNTLDIPGSLLDFQLFASEFGGVLQGVNAAMSELRSNVASFPSRAADAPPGSFKAALREAASVDLPPR